MRRLLEDPRFLRWSALCCVLLLAALEQGTRREAHLRPDREPPPPAPRPYFRRYIKNTSGEQIMLISTGIPRK